MSVLSGKRFLTCEVVVFLTRYAERDAERWMWADYYKYRIPLE